jgi:hypothetical protein
MLIFEWFKIRHWGLDTVDTKNEMLVESWKFLQHVKGVTRAKKNRLQDFLLIFFFGMPHLANFLV